MASTAEPVLIAGATGYIGGKLARRLRESGVATRCMARRPGSAGAKDLEEAGCEVVEGDVLKPATLGPALDGIGVAYYLVHSMGRGGDGDFEEMDRRGAENFARAASEAGVSQIVYLGGLGEGRSKHLRSRQETAEALASTGVPVTYLRAAVVLGGGSESFQTVYHLIRRLPAMVTPKWTKTRTQPIAVEDVISYLAAAGEQGEWVGREVQIAGPDVTTYGGMMEVMADAIGKRRPLMIRVPILTPRLSSLWIGLVTPVDTGVARPLVEGLSTETVITDPAGMQMFDIEPTGMDEAMEAAVAELASLGT